MKLGCFQSNKGLHAMDFQEFAQQAVALGYQSIDVPVQNTGAAALCRSLGLELHASGAFVPADLSPDPADQEAFVERARGVLDWAAGEGIGVITHLVGRAPGLGGDENLAIFKDVYTPIAAHAEVQGVRLAFENWPRNGTMLAITPELWDGMFHAVPSPALGLCYDPSHLFWLGIDPIQPMWDFKERIYHAHAKDTEILPTGRNRFGIYGRQLSRTTQSNWWRYRLPGFGQIDWYRYLDTLYQVGYDGVLSVEHEDPVWSDTPEQAMRGLRLAQQYLRPFLT